MRKKTKNTFKRRLRGGNRRMMEMPVQAMLVRASKPVEKRSTLPNLMSLGADDLESGEPLPEGYETVPHWWATMEAEALDGLTNPIETFLADADKLQQISTRRGIKFYWLAAGRAYREIGLFSVRAFPLWLLAEFYPFNP